MWNLRAQLLGDSPHLSQDVLRNMSDRTDVFPDDVLLEILSANPDELSRDTLLQYLEQKEDPLPGYMIDILEQAAGGVTYKTILEREMAEYHAGKVSAAQYIIRSILNDSIMNTTDYQNWLDNLESLSTDKQIIASYLNQGDTSSALALLDLLPGLYNLQGDRFIEYSDYKDLLIHLINWKYSGKSFFSLDSTDIDTLENYAYNKKGTARMMARNILTYAYNYNFCDCMHINDSTYYKIEEQTINKMQNSTIGLKLVVEPNPAKSWIALNYQIPYVNEVGHIYISDITGQRIKQFTVYGKQGQEVWDIRWLKSGVYIYNFVSNGFAISGKIIVN